MLSFKLWKTHSYEDIANNCLACHRRWEATTTRRMQW